MKSFGSTARASQPFNGILKGAGMNHHLHWIRLHFDAQRPRAKRAASRWLSYLTGPTISDDVATLMRRR